MAAELIFRKKRALLRAIYFSVVGKPITKNDIREYRKKFRTVIERLETLSFESESFGDLLPQKQEYKKFVAKLVQWETEAHREYFEDFNSFSRSPLKDFVHGSLLTMRVRNIQSHHNEAIIIQSEIIKESYKLNLTFTEKQQEDLFSKILLIIQRYRLPKGSEEDRIYTVLKSKVKRNAERKHLELKKGIEKKSPSKEMTRVLKSILSHQKTNK